MSYACRIQVRVGCIGRQFTAARTQLGTKLIACIDAGVARDEEAPLQVREGRLTLGLERGPVQRVTESHGAAGPSGVSVRTTRPETGGHSCEQPLVDWPVFVGK